MSSRSSPSKNYGTYGGVSQEHRSERAETLPDWLREYVAHVDKKDIQTNQTTDPFPKWGEKYSPGKNKEDAYLQILKITVEGKTRTCHLNDCAQLVDFIMSTLDPYACFGFIKVNRPILMADKVNPYVTFLKAFASQYMPEVTGVGRYDTFHKMLSGGPLPEDMRVCHKFIRDVKEARLSLGEGYFAPNAAVVDLRRRLPETLRTSVLSSGIDVSSWDEWIRVLEQKVNDRLQDAALARVAPVPFDNTFDNMPNFPPAPLTPTPNTDSMDLDALKAEICALRAEMSRPKGPKCFECEGFGHFARECPNRKKKNGKGGKEGKGGKGGGSGTEPSN